MQAITFCDRSSLISQMVIKNHFFQIFPPFLNKIWNSKHYLRNEPPHSTYSKESQDVLAQVPFTTLKGSSWRVAECIIPPTPLLPRLSRPPRPIPKAPGKGTGTWAPQARGPSRGHSYRGCSQFRALCAGRAAKNAWRIDSEGSIASWRGSFEIRVRVPYDLSNGYRILSKHSIVVGLVLLETIHRSARIRPVFRRRPTRKNPSPYDCLLSHRT